MKNCMVIVIIASAMAISVVIARQKAEAQNSNSQSVDKTGTMIGKDEEATNNQGNPPIFVTEVPPGYRDWKLISVAHEEGALNDLRAILGNDIALKAYREGKLPFPEGSIIARVAWSYFPSEENNKIFSQMLKRDVQQSFVAGSPTNGVQFMIKDSKKYATTGGWGYGQFDGGKPVGAAMLKNCFPCHQGIRSRDFIFTRYAP